MSNYYTVDASAMAALADSVKKPAGGGGTGEWLKMQEGSYDLRIMPPWSDQGTVFRAIRNHNGPFTKPYKNAEGYRKAPMCFKFIFSQEDISSILAERDVLTPDDFALYKEHGCPCCKIPEGLMAKGLKDEANDWWPRTQYLWNVLDVISGKVFKWSTSKRIQETIETQYALNPNLFDPVKGRSFMIKATGEGKNRRYSTPAFYPEDSALPEGLTVYDLDAAMIKGVQTFNDMLSMVVNNHTQEFSLEERLTPGLISYAKEIKLL